jgi:spore coat polysaccharide biosynthesis predicted glycosyltransferase SpsG
MKIAIITDGNNTLGMGHVYQSISLAGFFVQKNLSPNDIIFLTQSGKNVIKLITESRFLVNQYPDDDTIFNALKNENPDRIIFDKLDVSPELALRIKEEMHIRLTIFTNLTEANLYADITVLADIGSNFSNIYRKEEKTGQIQFFGPKYWLLRPEFYEYKKKQKTRAQSTKNIMLILGGADMSNLSCVILNTILQIDLSFNIIVVLGSAFIHNRELDEVISNNSM